MNLSVDDDEDEDEPEPRLLSEGGAGGEADAPLPGSREDSTSHSRSLIKGPRVGRIKQVLIMVGLPGRGKVRNMAHGTWQHGRMAEVPP